MIRSPHLLFLAGLVCVSRLALAATCPTTEPFTVPPENLTATKAAIDKGSLTVMTLGGAATLGRPADGPGFTYPARLSAHLTEAFPGVSVKVVIYAVPRQSGAELERKLNAELVTSHPALVIWGPGASAAGRGDDLDTFANEVSGTVDQIRASGADLILMTLQYAPSVARVINLPPYRSAVLRVAETAGVPVFDRYDLMRYWSDNDFLDLDATKPEERVQVARTLYDCMAKILTEGIVDGVR